MKKLVLSLSLLFISLASSASESVCTDYGGNPRAYLNSYFFDAIKRDDLKMFLEYLKCPGLTIHTREDTNMGWPVLTVAADNNSKSITKFLLKQPKLNINEVGRPTSGYTERAFSVALYRGNFELARMIAKHPKFNPNLLMSVADGSKTKALGVAFWEPAGDNVDHETIEILFSRKDLDINAPDTNVLGNTTALHAALSNRNPKYAVRLIQRPEFKFPPQKFSRGGAIVSDAISFPKVLELLIKRDDVDVNYKMFSQTPLFRAIAFATSELNTCDMYYEGLKVLLSTRKTDVNPVQSGYSAGSLLAKKNCVDTLKLFLARPDFNVNFKDVSASTVLEHAIQNSSVEMAKAILHRADVDVNVTNEYGETPLMRAVSAQDGLELVKLLIANPKIDLNKRELDGFTALSIAIQRGQDEIAEVLRLAGAKE